MGCRERGSTSPTPRPAEPAAAATPSAEADQPVERVGRFDAVKGVVDAFVDTTVGAGQQQQRFVLQVVGEHGRRARLSGEVGVDLGGRRIIKKKSGGGSRG